MEHIQKIGVTTFIIINNKVLIVERSQNENFLPGYFELPGGKVEFGEQIENALLREVKEETNLKIKVIRPYSTFAYTSADRKKQTIDIQFICGLNSNIKDINLSSEHSSYKLIEREEIKNYKISKEMKKAIQIGFEQVS